MLICLIRSGRQLNSNTAKTCRPLRIRQNHITVGYPKVILYTKFEHFGIIRFSAPDISVKNTLIEPVTLTYDL